MGKNYLTPNQVADKLQIPERTLRRWIKNGKFPKGKEISRECIRWSECLVEQWLDCEDNT